MWRNPRGGAARGGCRSGLRHPGAPARRAGRVGDRGAVAVAARRAVLLLRTFLFLADTVLFLADTALGVATSRQVEPPSSTVDRRSSGLSVHAAVPAWALRLGHALRPAVVIVGEGEVGVLVGEVRVFQVRVLSRRGGPLGVWQVAVGNPLHALVVPRSDRFKHGARASCGPIA